ncbi:sphingomyelin phosphodiesterase 3 [Latimeria chalumnae]|uniref:Sphingomyelin phosphodiesterase 3 n=1 Tax=Latimeria chalumnae TaxID=7897 RepID=H2ZVG3_LATCH|nr:PREDICTED: sphingomyelin phosphodiesterase 3 [Latimeria chalumnae]|eukprot:XP_006008482.1 PREDICTED: sphingomyelin phosphodiesterase 3 [Latimeria chalumnae]
MVLYTSLFSSTFLRGLHSFSWALIFPCYWFLDQLLSCFVPTSYEKHQRVDDPCYFRALCIVIITPIYLTLLVVSLPFALIGFLLWAPLQSVRKPYRYSKFQSKAQASGNLVATEWKATGSSKSFCFGTANLCLLPESLARFTNLSNTQGRSQEIGRRIRNGASRPQIKIYIDSPTNTSISAASFSSLVSPQSGENANRPINQGIRRTSSMEYKGDHASSNNIEESAKPTTEPIDSDSLPCIIRIMAEDGSHIAENDIEAATVQINITSSMDQPAETETEGQKGQVPNHKAKEGDTGSLDSRTASRESLTKYRIADGIVDANKLIFKQSVMKKASVRKKKHMGDAFDHEISSFFPANLDFLCLQEVFDKRAAEKLKDLLHPYFEFVLFDVGLYACRGCCDFKFLNSGLFFASRFPILDAAYHCYPNGKGLDSLAAKGALFVKVQVGTTPQDQRIVGYISTTHLHALAGDTVVRCEQLDFLQDWLAEFRKSTSSSSTANPEELVAFDVVCGDLNFDNCSSDDKLEQQHSLFTHYKDPCRLSPGEEKPWAIGTLLDPEGLYDEEVCSPDNLQKVLENEEGRKEYLVYPTSKNNCSSQKGRKIPLKGNGRRIDYVLYTEEGVNTDWKVEVEELSFVTQLAGLTDHVPVAMRLMVFTGEEEQ